MSTAVRDLRNLQSADPWRQRVDAGDWDAITAEIDEYGGALLPQLLTAGETGTRCTATSTVTSSSPCRSSST